MLIYETNTGWRMTVLERDDKRSPEQIVASLISTGGLKHLGGSRRLIFLPPDHPALAAGVRIATVDFATREVTTEVVGPPARAVREECARRIEAAYPLHRQINILRSGSHQEQADMSAHIDGLRACSNAMEPDPPLDFLDDKKWRI